LTDPTAKAADPFGLLFEDSGIEDSGTWIDDLPPPEELYDSEPMPSGRPQSQQVEEEPSQTIGRYHPGLTLDSAPGIAASSGQGDGATPSAVFVEFTSPPQSTVPRVDVTRPGFGGAAATMRTTSPTGPTPRLGPPPAPRPRVGLPRSGVHTAAQEEHVAPTPVASQVHWRGSPSGAQSALDRSAILPGRPQQVTPMAIPRPGASDSGRVEQIGLSRESGGVGGVGGGSGAWPRVQPAAPASASSAAFRATTGNYSAQNPTPVAARNPTPQAAPHPALARASGMQNRVPPASSNSARASAIHPILGPGSAPTPASSLFAITPGIPVSALGGGLAFPASGQASGNFATIGAMDHQGPTRWNGRDAQLLDQAIQVLLPSSTPAAARMALHEVLEPQRVSAGTILVQEDSPANRVWLVVTGTLRVDIRIEGANTPLTAVQPGELAGIDLLIGQRQSRATVTAQTEALLAALDQRALGNLERKSAAALTRLLAGMLAGESRRVRAEQQQIMETLTQLVPPPAPQPETRSSGLGLGLSKLFRRTSRS
jgi:CRP-like cAMP-binding protein